MPNYTEDSLANYYNQNISKYGNSRKALMWNSHHSQTIRYEKLCDQLDQQHCSICDVGCGCGDLFHYIKYHKLPLDYTGIDISANMIVAAQTAYPTGLFRCLSLDNIIINHSFDCIVASGIFNLRMLDHDNTVFNIIQSMIHGATTHIRFNVLTNDYQHASASQGFVYTDVDALYNRLRPLVSHIHLIRDYLPHDVTFYLEK
ncbi:hypothetical protein DID74_00940 [Candidatus Marinamargulisbacteria bacterium SCGC AG-333-B06]|nr:hypothetical protein DID74_00940 [Candidatus Marinamargulisbacteria bacterium SCGC AG-333-B06]